MKTTNHSSSPRDPSPIIIEGVSIPPQESPPSARRFLAELARPCKCQKFLRFQRGEKNLSKDLRRQTRVRIIKKWNAIQDQSLPVKNTTGEVFFLQQNFPLFSGQEDSFHSRWKSRFPLRKSSHRQNVNFKRANFLRNSYAVIRPFNFLHSFFRFSDKIWNLRSGEK